MDPSERRVLEAIDMDALLETLDELVAIESVGGRETPAQERMAELMQEIGLDVETWPLDLDRLRSHPAYTVEIDRDEALGVIGRLGSGTGPTLILNGHVDVVPAGEPDRWTYPPWRATVDGARVYGRGTADMKGALCCALFAMKALVDADVSPPGTVVLQSVVGEEDGGLGTLGAVEHGSVGDAAIVMEPTQLMVAPAQAGALSFRITVPGKAAHGALREEGMDPIEKFIPLYHAVKEFEAQRNRGVDAPLFSAYDIPFALCIGTVNAGVWPSTVAETLTAEGRLGVGPHEALDAVRDAFEEVVHETAQQDDWLRDHPPRVSWRGAQFAPARIPPAHPIVSTVTGACQAVTGQPPPVQGMPYGADMRLLVNQGDTPTVLFGPGGVRSAHAPNESVPIQELEVAAKVLALTMVRYHSS